MVAMSHDTRVRCRCLQAGLPYVVVLTAFQNHDSRGVRGTIRPLAGHWQEIHGAAHTVRAFCIKSVASCSDMSGL